MAREVEIKNMTINQVVKNKGVEFSVTDGEGKHAGDFYVTKTGVEWCSGKNSEETE
ncbi:MAG: hypothetical protein GDA52_00640 [Rhodobacteraceae bacterium]|nr:hypothetical protein [Paracoccaceae bacterium]